MRGPMRTSRVRPSAYSIRKQPRSICSGEGSVEPRSSATMLRNGRLVFVFDRLGFVNARESNNVQTGVEHAAHGEQQVTGAIAEIGTESDVSVLNH